MALSEEKKEKAKRINQVSQSISHIRKTMQRLKFTDREKDYLNDEIKKLEKELATVRAT